jgi:hypothetical protein
LIVFFFFVLCGPFFFAVHLRAIRDVTPKRIRFSSEKTSARNCAALAINCFDRERTRYTEKTLRFYKRA